MCVRLFLYSIVWCCSLRGDDDDAMLVSCGHISWLPLLEEPIENPTHFDLRLKFERSVLIFGQLLGNKLNFCILLGAPFRIGFHWGWN